MSQVVLLATTGFDASLVSNLAPRLRYSDEHRVGFYSLAPRYDHSKDAPRLTANGITLRLLVTAHFFDCPRDAHPSRVEPQCYDEHATISLGFLLQFVLVGMGLLYLSPLRLHTNYLCALLMA